MKKIALIISIPAVILIGLVYFAWFMPLQNDNRLINFVQKDINNQIRTHNYKKLKTISANKSTFETLKMQKKIQLLIQDGQGSNVAYYLTKLKGNNKFDLTIFIKTKKNLFFEYPTNKYQVQIIKASDQNPKIINYPNSWGKN